MRLPSLSTILGNCGYDLHVNIKFLDFSNCPDPGTVLRFYCEKDLSTSDCQDWGKSVLSKLKNLEYLSICYIFIKYRLPEKKRGSLRTDNLLHFLFYFLFITHSFSLLIVLKSIFICFYCSNDLQFRLHLLFLFYWHN